MRATLTMPGPKGVRHYLTTRVPVKDEAARYYGLFGIATDIWTANVGA